MVYTRTFHFGLNTSKSHTHSSLNNVSADGGDLYWYLSQGKAQSDYLGDYLDAFNEFMYEAVHTIAVQESMPGLNLCA